MQAPTHKTATPSRWTSFAPSAAEQRGRAMWEQQRSEAQAIARQAARRIEDEEKRRKQLELIATLLAAVATTLAAGAGISVGADVPDGVTAASAFGAALVSGLTKALHPGELAHRLRVESCRLLCVIDEAGYVDRLLAADSGTLSFERVERQLQQLQEHRNDALKGAIDGEPLWTDWGADGDNPGNKLSVIEND